MANSGASNEIYYSHTASDFVYRGLENTNRKYTTFGAAEDTMQLVQTEQ